MNKKKSGVTLLELIIALAITITILGIAGSMFTTGNKVFNDSDVKSTLQIEGQAIQEKISDIGMQGIEVVSVNDEELIIKSYVKEDDVVRYFNIKKEDDNLKIYKNTERNFTRDKNISSYVNIKSLKITSTNSDKSINFSIVLTKKNIDHPIAFTINLRNKGIS